jgi:outer membrane protein assembly factor BamB
MITRRLAIAACAVCATAVSYAQIGKITQQDWVTSRADAQRTSWIRGDIVISPDAMQKPGFELRWKATLDNQARQLHSLSAGVVIGNLGFGSKPLSFVTGSANRVFAVDNDTGVVFWQRTFGDSGGGRGTLQCPGGITSAATRPTTVVPTMPVWRGMPDRPAYSSGVGAPGEGVPAYLMGRAGRATAPAPAPAPARAGGTPVAANPPARGGGAPAAPFPQVVYALSSDGDLHTLGPYAGKDLVRPFAFLPPNAHASDLIAVNDAVYTATMNGCSGVADGVSRLDLASANGAVKTWTTMGGSPTGAPAFGSNGTLFVAIGARATSGNDGYANAVVALDPNDLTIKDWFTQPTTEFVTPPLVLTVGTREVVAAGTRDGTIVLLDAASLGGPSHGTPLGRSTPSSDRSGFVANGLTTWSDSAGMPWVLMPTATAVTAMKIVTSNGAPALQAGWTSRLMRAPLSPVIVNGVAFVVSSGEFVPRAGATADSSERARQSMPAVLYALDATTGRELWSSGSTITSFVHGSAVWPGIGQMHVATFDNTVYAFGFPLERN